MGLARHPFNYSLPSSLGFMFDNMFVKILLAEISTYQKTASDRHTKSAAISIAHSQISVENVNVEK